MLETALPVSPANILDYCCINGRFKVAKPESRKIKLLFITRGHFLRFLFMRLIPFFFSFLHKISLEAHNIFLGNG